MNSISELVNMDSNDVHNRDVSPRNLSGLRRQNERQAGRTGIQYGRREYKLHQTPTKKDQLQFQAVIQGDRLRAVSSFSGRGPINGCLKDQSLEIKRCCLTA
jgi:hypothetical protein